MRIRYKYLQMRSNDPYLITKLISLTGYISLILSLYIIVGTPTVDKYEVSIYAAYPLRFWLFLLLAFTCGIIVMLYHIFINNRSKWMILGPILIILSNIICILLPKIRGYLLYGRGEDNLSHLGLIKDIVTMGHWGESNFYPIAHIFGSSLLLILNLSMEDLLYAFMLVFYLFYFTNLYLLAKSSSKDYRTFLLIVSFSAPLIYSFFFVTVSPNVLCVFMIPLLLYFFQEQEFSNSNALANTIGTLIVGFVITFFHPVTALFVILILLSYRISFKLYTKHLLLPTCHFKEHLVKNKSSSLVLVLIVLFFAWYLSYSIILGALKIVFLSLTQQLNDSIYESQISLLSTHDLSIRQITFLVLQKFGAICVFLILASYACCMNIKSSLLKDTNVDQLNFTYSILFIVASLTGAIMLFKFPLESNLVRLARFSLLIGTILCGLFYSNHILTHRCKINQIIYLSVLGVLIILIASLSVISIYNSPNSYLANSQVTAEDIAGSKWFCLHEIINSDIILRDKYTLMRFIDYNFGKDSSMYSHLYANIQLFPDYFGYDKKESIVSSNGPRNAYLVIFRVDDVASENFPLNIKESSFYPSPRDYAKLSHDRNAFKIYENGLLDLWSIIKS